ncbi:hypothetical protein BJX99DRAFT_248715 [Aspergillus californicus]
MNPSLNADTPPPPPPKPSSHEASRRGTPQVNSPLPGTPQLQHSYSQSQYGTDISRIQPPNTSNVNYAPHPPTIEEGWLPDGVKEKSTTDLQKILETPALITSLSSLHPSYESHTSSLQSILTYNKDLAKQLLSLQSQLTTLRSSTETLLLKNQSLEVSWRKKQVEMDGALAPWSPKALYQRLSAGIAEQEAVCLAVEESFLDDEHGEFHGGRATEKEVADWVRRVRSEGGKLAGRREAKARWDEGRVGGWR